MPLSSHLDRFCNFYYIFYFKIGYVFVSECGLFTFSSGEFGTVDARGGFISSDLRCRRGIWGALLSVMTEAQADLVYRVITHRLQP